MLLRNLFKVGRSSGDEMNRRNYRSLPVTYFEMCVDEWTTGRRVIDGP